MKKLQFKTNIHCSGCKAAVTPFLDGEKGIDSWSVDLEDSRNLLTVEGEDISTELVTNLLAEAGYTAVPAEPGK